MKVRAKLTYETVQEIKAAVGTQREIAIRYGIALSYVSMLKHGYRDGRKKPGREPTHGDTSGKTTPEYMAWGSMKSRCLNPNHDSYADYGGRGITICQEWIDSYEAFLAHIGRRPSVKHSIERIDNSKGYTPGNVKWATAREQSWNRRSSRLITYSGETKPLVEWARLCGLTSSSLSHRLDALHWPMEKAISKPTRLRYITLNGETKQLYKWAQSSGISIRVLEKRLNKLQWTVDRALTEPVGPARYRKAAAHA